MEFKPTPLFGEESLVPELEQAQMKLEVLEEVLEGALYPEQYHEIMEEVKERLTPRLLARHLDLKRRKA